MSNFIFNFKCLMRFSFKKKTKTKKNKNLNEFNREKLGKLIENLIKNLKLKIKLLGSLRSIRICLVKYKKVIQKKELQLIINY